jgi:cell division protein FtsB
MEDKQPNPFLKLLKNLYFLAGSFFLVWMIFFDSNNLLNHIKTNNKYQELEYQQKYYEDAIRRLQREMKELSDDPKEIEKFARERYQYKKKGEDVYIVD